MNTSKIQTKKILSQVSSYFSNTNILTKPETNCVKDMSVGILKSKSVHVNKIAASLREPIVLKKTAKRMSEQYLKDDFARKVRINHLESSSVNQKDFIVIDGSDIIKKYAKCMEGLEVVRDGDTGAFGLGYNFINVNAVDAQGDIKPLFSKAYSFEMGAYSWNNEIKKAVGLITEHFGEKGTFVIDREADREILKDYFFNLPNSCIMRLKKNTKTYELGAIRVRIEAKGKTHNAWLVVSRNKEYGGLCYLLVKSDKTAAIEVAGWAFEGYGKRWKIEEYHRHIKQSYRLEDIQMRTFNGLQSLLAILSVAMYILYKKTSALHIKLLLESGFNYLNKHRISELTNFIYYKLSKIVSHLLMPVTLRWKIDEPPPDTGQEQLNLMFN